jgi:glycosyltransferase involved in cell wall biosynthesis
MPQLSVAGHGMLTGCIIDISIIICTYNRCDSLKATLQSILSANIDDAISTEIVVIDNNSTDQTKQVTNQFLGNTDIEIRYFLEQKQGLSFARNRGVKEAAGEILVFADDDVIVDKEWVNNIFAAFRDSEVSCVGGRIYPLWGKRCPQWLNKELHSFLALLDLGDEKVKMSMPHLWGANLIFRSSMFEKYGMFDTSLGRTAVKLYGNEEIVFLKTLIDNGEGVYYVPEIIVHHCIGANRMKKSYFRKWVFDAGELDAIQMGYYSSRNLFGVPLYVLKDAFIKIMQCIAGKIRSQENNFVTELSFVRTAGFILGRIKMGTSLKGRHETNI